MKEIWEVMLRPGLEAFQVLHRWKGSSPAIADGGRQDLPSGDEEEINRLGVQTGKAEGINTRQPIMPNEYI